MNSEYEFLKDFPPECQKLVAEVYGAEAKIWPVAPKKPKPAPITKPNLPPEAAAGVEQKPRQGEDWNQFRERQKAEGRVYVGNG